MTRFKRRLLIAITLVLLVFVVVGVWLYFSFFASTSATLRHAEAFIFRRMKVAQLAEQGMYRFFFITNRRLESNEGPLKQRFGREREARLKFGFFDARIQPTVGLGMLINPSEWFENEEIHLMSVNELGQAAFVKQIQKLVQDSPYRSLLIVVHGFREAFESGLRKTAFVGHVLDINSPVLVFDWPGNQGSTPRGYLRARQVAEASGAELAQTIQLVINEIKPDRLWLMANSMGAEVVVDAFSLLYREADLADAQTEIEDVVLTAPDVDHEEFNNQLKLELKALALKTTVYVSSNDRALLISRIINRGKRLGESTLSPDMMGEAIRVANLVEPGSGLIDLVDVTPVNRTRNFHNFSLETPEFFDELFLRLTNIDVPNHRPMYQVEAPNGAVYWVLTRGR
ncbi:MAG: alpha/beta hydrolase [Desulfobacterales bacterium]|jgi:esterase/lipase superfamily enzyme